MQQRTPEAGRNIRIERHVVVGIGHHWAGTHILMLIRDLNIRTITEDTGELIRELTLDPSRDYQPTGRDRYARWRHQPHKVSAMTRDRCQR